MDLLLPLFQTSFIKIAGPVTFLAALGFFAWRVGSIYTVLERVWRLIVGRVEVSDPALKYFIQETRDVEKFRFMFRIDVVDVKEIHKVVNWLKYYSIKVSKAQRARKWINVKTEGLIVDLPARYFGRRLVGAFLFSLGVVFLVGVYLLPSAVLQMKESKIWLLADPKTISHLGGGWKIALEDCDKGFSDVRKTTGFNDDEVKAVCETFKTNELEKIVKKSMRQQKGLAVGLGASCFYFLLVLFSQMIAFSAAEEIKGIINRKIDSKI